MKNLIFGGAQVRQMRLPPSKPVLLCWSMVQADLAEQQPSLVQRQVKESSPSETKSQTCRYSTIACIERVSVIDLTQRLLQRASATTCLFFFLVLRRPKNTGLKPHQKLPIHSTTCQSKISTAYRFPLRQKLRHLPKPAPRVRIACQALTKPFHHQ